MFFAAAIHGGFGVGVENVARLPAFDRGGFLKEIRIPRFAEADGLRELRGGQRLEAVPFPSAGAAERHAVQPFEMARADDTEPRNIRIGTERRDFLFERHQRKNIVHARFDPEPDSERDTCTAPSQRQ